MYAISQNNLLKGAQKYKKKSKDTLSNTWLMLEPVTNEDTVMSRREMLKQVCRSAQLAVAQISITEMPHNRAH